MMVLNFVNFEYSTLWDSPIVMFLPDTNNYTPQEPTKKGEYAIVRIPLCFFIGPED